jgi:hypothetical protein
LAKDGALALIWWADSGGLTLVESFSADVPEPEEGSEEQLDPVPLMDRSCVANVLEKVH